MFSSHIGKRGNSDQNSFEVDHRFYQWINVVFNAITKNDYRCENVSTDVFYFDVDNPKEIKTEQNYENGEVLMNIFNRVMSDDQLRENALENAQMRQRHVPMFTQLYKEYESFEVEKVNAEDTEIADDIELFSHDVIDEIIEEANDGKFSLENEIVQISGFKTNNY